MDHEVFPQEGQRSLPGSGNPKYPRIKPQSELCLGGVVTAVVKKYHT